MSVNVGQCRFLCYSTEFLLTDHGIGSRIYPSKNKGSVMARIRNIKPGFFQNEILAELSFEARLAFIGLWTLADSDGRLEDRPKRIGSLLFPYDQIDLGKILHDLEANGFIQRYTTRGVACILITNFAKHQHISRQEAMKRSDLVPEPNESGSTTTQQPHQNEAGVAARRLTTDKGQLTTDKGQLTRAQNAAVAAGLFSTSTLAAGSEPEPEPAKAEKCPLANLPLLAGAYPDIRSAILVAHPRAVVPVAGSKGCFGDREALARLNRLDGYPERMIRDVLLWVLRDEPDGDFTWRQQFQSIRPLRQVRNGTTKFTKMWAAWDKATQKTAAAKKQVEGVLSGSRNFGF